jgi:hypothetical protein
MNRHGTTRRGRWAPEVLPLEARQLMAANVGGGAIRFREVGTGDAATLYVLGTNRDDVIRVEDNGSAGAGNITVVTGTGKTYTTRRAVAVVQVSGRNGNDQVGYNLNAPLIAPRSVLSFLGAGHDRFTGTVAQPVQTTKILDIEAFGDVGNDVLAVHQSGAVMAGTVFPFLDGGDGDDAIAYSLMGPVAAGATVGPGLLGGAGDDAIGLAYAGENDGQVLYNATIDAGDGDDVVDAAIAVAANSTGKLGIDAATPAIVQGGAGDDDLRVVVTVDPTATTTTSTTTKATTAQVFAIAPGGEGRDTVRRTANVRGDLTSEIDAVVG